MSIALSLEYWQWYHTVLFLCAALCPLINSVVITAIKIFRNAKDKSLK